MLDIKRIEENFEEVSKSLKNRNEKYYDSVLMLMKKYQKYKILLQKIELKSFERNHLSKESKIIFGNKLVKRHEIRKLRTNLSLSPKSVDHLDKSIKIRDELDNHLNNLGKLNNKKHDIREKQTNLKLEIQNLTTEKDKLFDLIQTNLLELPNILESAVPIGENESENIEFECWSEPKKFDFTPKPHWDIIKALDIVDFERSVKISGSRFVSYKKSGAKLMRALQNYMLDYHINKFGYEELIPPVIVNSTALMGTGQLPKFEADLFKIQHDKEYYLSPTAEVQITNFHQDEIINASDLPLKYCASTLCFRSEAGSAGRDTRGLIRMHQFNKIEIVKIVKPENSQEEHESLTEQAAGILKELKLPYRKMLLCSGETGFSAQKTYDLEVWLPSYNNYKEISSCSNFGDFQARRAKIRFKRELNSKAELVHTLNGSGLALDRTFAAIVENYQNKDGTITVPEVLVPYMNGQTKII